MVYAVYNPRPCDNCGPASDGHRICTGRCVPVQTPEQREAIEAAEERRRELLREHARLGISGH